MTALASPAAPARLLPHSSHWGAFFGALENGRLVVRPHPDDPDPAPILENLPDALSHPARILRPMARRGWLERGPGADPARGRDELVALDWQEAIELVAGELTRVYGQHGPQAVFGGSYGWSSAGRFHHAQSQVHRFLNVLGGYVRSVNTYSSGAANVIVPHILGPLEPAFRNHVTWGEVERHTEIVVAFGGMALKNGMVASGGNSRHVLREAIAAARRRGAEFVLVSPLRDDLPKEAEARWLAIRPGTDTAMMLGMAHTLLVLNLHDRAFLDRYTTGFDRFARYLTGVDDGTPKDAGWASAICGIEAEAIESLARSLAGRRGLITVSLSLQRAEFGEQPIWMGLTLAAMLGQIGLEGGGYQIGLGALGNAGKTPLAVPNPTLPQGQNPVRELIPVARIADMLLNPGEPFDYDGKKLVYPDIRLVYWAGGNPFHHHQDINRLRRAFARPETVIVHESAWTATARHADIVLPATVTLEREDIGAASNDALLIAMHQLAKPRGEALDDYAIFSRLAARLGREAAFTEGRTARQWLAHLYETTRKALLAKGLPAPDFEEFWEKGELALPEASELGGYVRAFRRDPEAAPLPTPSGRIEIFSSTIAGFGYPDCPGHPTWLAAEEGPGDPRFPLQLVANQPASRLHSQLDFGAHSLAGKIAGREPVRIHPADAAARGIVDGMIVRLFNDRGACLAAAVLSLDVRPGTAQLATGAWYDPLPREAEQALCVHGNPNVLTRDIGTSRLAQGCAGQLTIVEIEPFEGPPPPITAFDPPGGAAVSSQNSE